METPIASSRHRHVALCATGVEAPLSSIGRRHSSHLAQRQHNPAQPNGELTAEYISFSAY